MFKEHPKGLIVAFFANMGERFGFYTMMAILVLFLQAKYGVNAETAGSIYSWFYFAIYALALLGGILADATKKYKTIILSGIIIMFIGYVMMAIPGMPLSLTVTFLLIIALGNGLFKGNLQAVVGQMYDNPRYEHLRDKAFLVFYMGINVGAFFAPFAATAIRNWWLNYNGFAHDGSLPALCHALLDGKLNNTARLAELANEVSLTGPITNLEQFAQQYIDVFSRGYNYAFAIAAGAMLVSLLVYIFFSKHLPNKEVNKSAPSFKMVNGTTKIGISFGAMALVTLAVYLVFGNLDIGFAFGLFAGFVAWMLQVSTKEELPRVSALLLVFVVVIFFWMSFHQNGLTQTIFARDYTVQTVGPFTFLFFRLDYILAFIGAVVGLVLLVRKKSDSKMKILGGTLLAGCGFLTWYFYSRGEAVNAIAPEIFQSFNPLFIVSLTFLVMGIFNWLAGKGKEPSTPRKIGIGMIIASFGFLIMLLASVDVVSPVELQGEPVPESSRVSPYWLMSSYLVLTIAELFLSPMGLSFVSKVSPVRFQGLMQGGWLLATAVGNKLLGIGSYFWDRLELWQLWAIFVLCCIISAAFIFSIMKKLEKLTS